MEISREVFDKRGIYWENRITVFLQETIPTKPIVFIGDSLIERFQLERYFGKGFVNRGIGGDHADGLWERRDLLALDKDPKALFFMVGINDLLFDYKRDEVPYHLERIVSYAKQKAPGAKIVIHSICPVRNWERPTPEELIKINGELQTLAAKYEAAYIDLFQHFKDENNLIQEKYTIDGVHLSEEAYELWANEVKKWLKKLDVS